MPNSKRNQLSHHDGKRKHGDLPWHDVAQEETVDDLLIASMAVASTWCDEASPHPAVDNSSASESAIERDDSKENDHDSDHDDIAEADEISISSSNQDGSAPNSKEDDDTELMGQSDNNEKSLNLRVVKEDESDDDGSDIDLTEHLANMEDDDDDAPKNSKGNQAKVVFSIYEGPKTEHEIDPYKCPTDELEKLNVCVGIEMDNIGDPTILDDATRNRLRIAGTIRTYLVDQRTIVVDSLIPAALQSDFQNHHSMDATLDEGSMLAILLGKGCGMLSASSWKNRGSFWTGTETALCNSSPDPPKAERSSGELATEEKPKLGPSDMTSNEDGAAARSLAKIEAIESTENVNDVERMRSTISEEVENKDTEIDGSVSVEKNPEQVSAINGAIHDTSEEKIAPEPSEEQDDPWCHKGKLSCILRNTPNAIVYSLVDHVKLIDKDLIIRGKGCDASNMFDEEVGPSEQQDFSDDEEERQAKRGNRKSRQPGQHDGQSERKSDDRKNFSGRSSVGRSGGRGRGRGHGRGMGPTHGYVSHNSHHTQQQQQQQPFYHAQPTALMQYQYPNPGYTQTHQPYPPHTSPQFYQGGYPPQYNQQSFQAQSIDYGGHPGYIYGAPPPPPPPPPRQNNMPGQYSQQQQTGNAVPPSTQGDTVYYDYSGS
eukprot:CCRYP_002788-RA/>CCRYP_002788-RA protein AED:0.12 eAED:0.12 QI:0/0.33/0.25/1/1/1/4/705/655